MPRINILPKPGEDIVVIGQNGSGKTWLLRKLAQAVQGKITIHILNTKDDDEFRKIRDSREVTNYKDVKTLLTPVRIYTPNGRELRDDDLLDTYLNDRYVEGRNITIIDELSQVVKRGDIGVGGLNLLSRGRSKLASAWIGIQRPANVSRYPFSEAKAFYIFRLNDKKDRMRVAEFTHPNIASTPPPRFKFWFYRYDMDEPLLLGPV